MAIKIFGFNLTETSALLLFISGMIFVFVGGYGIYQVFQTYNITDTIAIGFLLFYGLILLFGVYLVFKTIKHRDKS